MQLKLAKRTSAGHMTDQLITLHYYSIYLGGELRFRQIRYRQLGARWVIIGIDVKSVRKT